MADEAARAGQRVTWMGAGANAILVVAKLSAGWVGGSQALVADAVHSLSDLITDAIVLVGLAVGRRAPDADHHFGHRRVETLASAAVGIALILAAAGLGWEAVDALWSRTASHPTWPALVGAILSIAVKEALYHWTARVGRAIRSPVVVANAWHHRSDALSSVAVLLGTGIAVVWPSLHFLDAGAALLVAFLVLKVGLDVLWSALREMTDAAPPSDCLERMGQIVDRVEGVLGHHDLKARTLGGLHHVQVHVVVEAELTVRQGHGIAQSVEAALMALDDVGQVMVHVDPDDERTDEHGT